MSARATVLFVDDEEAVLLALKALCRDHFDVLTVTSAARALEVVQSRPIHVIVSDQCMPGMQGVELLRRVRELSPETMRLMLTAYSDLAAIIGSIGDGEIYRYIYKPWSNKDLIGTIEAAAHMALDADRPLLADNAAHGARQPTLLVIDDDPEVHRSVERLYVGPCNVRSASNCDGALDVLERESVAVLICDTMVADQDMAPFIRVLKEQQPAIVIVMLTKLTDTATVVGLINDGQVFRFLGKPFHQAQLRVSIDAALLYYAKFRDKPKLLSHRRSMRVAPTAAGRNAAGGFAPTLLARLRSLRGVSSIAP